MRSNVVVKELSINVASADQSYMPQRVVVSGGRDEMNLRELNDVRIPRYGRSWSSHTPISFSALTIIFISPC